MRIRKKIKENCLPLKLGATPLAFCLICALADPGYGQIGQSEYQLKAAYLRKIANFVEWPVEALNKKPNITELVHVCVVGNYSFGVFLAQETARASVTGRRMQVRWIHKMGEISGCQVLFVSQSEKNRYGNIVESIRRNSVLTIGESEGFLEAGGIVELNYKKDKLQFDVNLAAARSSRLKLDARLLSMAKRVIPESERAGS